MYQWEVEHSETVFLISDCKITIKLVEQRLKNKLRNILSFFTACKYNEVFSDDKLYQYGKNFGVLAAVTTSIIRFDGSRRCVQNTEL